MPSIAVQVLSRPIASVLEFAVMNNELQTRVKNAKLLVVGAGGIGCELLKCLVQSGFEHMHVVRAYRSRTVLTHTGGPRHH